MLSENTDVREAASAEADAVRAAAVASLRRRGTHGGVIEPHRSIATVRFSRRDFAVALVLTIVFSVIVVLGLGAIGDAWAWIFQRLSGPLGFPQWVVARFVRVGFISFSVPAFAVDAQPPSTLTWWVTLIITVVAALLSYLIRRNLPLAYLIRLAAVTQGTALLFFGLWPTRFPYPLAGYVTSMLVASATIITLVPVVLGFTFYVIDVGLLQKIGLTLAVVGHLIVFVPLQFAVHTYLIYRGSLLFLPPLFMLLGLLPQVVIFIAFYGWGMSWNARGYRQSRE